jgi:hypothetical protein
MVSFGAKPPVKDKDLVNVALLYYGSLFYVVCQSVVEKTNIFST